MIIFGTRSTTPTVGHGTFVCPRCALERQYRQIAVRQWFTLYFIPVIPLGNRGEYVECTSCAGTFGMEILSYDPEAERVETTTTLRHIAALALGESRRLQPANAAALSEVMQAVGYGPCSEGELHRDWQLAQQAGAKLQSFAQSKVEEFSEKGRLLAVQLCIHAMRGSSPLDAECLDVLRRLCAGFSVGDNALTQLQTDEYRLIE